MGARLAGVVADVGSARWAGVLRALRASPPRLCARARAASEALLRSCAQMVARCRAARERAAAGSAEGEAMAEALLAQLDASGVRAEGDAALGTELCGFLLAGIAPVAAQLGWVLADLAAHPEHQRRLRAARRARSAGPGPGGAGARGPTSAADSLLRHAITESLRLHCALPEGAVRRLGREYPLGNVQNLPARPELHGSAQASAAAPPATSDAPRGHPLHPPLTDAPAAPPWLAQPPLVLPAGALVQLPAHALFRAPQHFAQPEAWRPSRWEGAEGGDGDGDSGDGGGGGSGGRAIFPFALGRHGCVGERLARTVLELCAGAVVDAFELSVAASPAHAPARGFAREPHGLAVTLAPAVA